MTDTPKHAARTAGTVLRAHLPAIGMVLAAILQAVVQLLDGPVNAHTILGVVIAGLGAVMTYLVPSFTEAGYRWVKTAVAAATAAVVILVDATANSGEITTQVILTAVVALIVGLGATIKGEPSARDYALAA